MKKVIYILAILMLVSSCSKNEDESLEMAIDIDKSPLIGEWKLTKIVNSFSTKETDYTKNKITFTFRSENSNDLRGKVIISEDNRAFKKGTYVYEMKSESITADQKNKLLMLIIGGTRFTYKYKNGEMELSNAYVDGPVLYLKKQ